MKPLIVGMNRGDGTSGPALLPGSNGASSADRLVKLSGLPRDEYISAYARTNLLDGKWTFPRSMAAGLLLKQKLIKRKRIVIVLGKQVWNALMNPTAEFFERVVEGEATFVLLPHPSGKNLLLNSPKVRRKFTKALAWAREQR